MRPQLEHGRDYIQQNLNNQIQLYEIQLNYGEEPSIKTLHALTLAY